MTSPATSDSTSEVVLVRPATSDDLPSLTELSVGVQQLHTEGRPDLFRSPDRPALREFLDSILTGTASVLVAEAEHTVIGYLVADLNDRSTNPFRFASRVFYVHHIAVAPTARRQGAGAALLDAARSEARSRGADSIRLDSWSFNHDAHAFFEAQGFDRLNVVFDQRLS